MTATAYRAQVSIPLYGDPSQNTSNTWYFMGAIGSSTADDLAEIHLRLEAFYTGIDNLIYPAQIVGSTATETYYDMSDPEPRTPIGSNTIALSPSASAAYPSDVSICLSYRADYPSGANRARRRGRVYLGPVASTVSVFVSQQGQRVAPAVVTALLARAVDLQTTAVTPITWAMWSETDGVARPIVEASVDNQLDTRRSRDNAASTRTYQAV